MSKRMFFWTILILLFCFGFLFGSFIKQTYFGEIKSKDGKTNILLLGIRGYDTNDSDLTDTIIFLSLDKLTRKAVLISIPRDLWIKDFQAKINSAYHFGGFELAKKTISEVLGQPIDYMVVINFESFGKIIDVLGGVNVNVQRTFDDFLYPIAGRESDLCNGDKEFKCRYETLHFEAGEQRMDGTLALKYIRSRHAQGEEGTDYARSVRQQQLLMALKQKILTTESYLNPGKIYRLWRTFQENLTIDINKKDYGGLFLLLSQIDWKQIKTVAINENILINPKNHYSKQWVLITKSGTWQEIHDFVKRALE